MVFISGLLISNACTSGNPVDDDHISKHIDAKEANQIIQNNLNNKDFVILDTRTEGEFNSGHIENCILVVFSHPSYKDELKKLDKNKKYLLYCRSGNRSGQTLKMMEKFGFKEAYNLKGGIIAWSREGYNLVK